MAGRRGEIRISGKSTDFSLLVSQRDWALLTGPEVFMTGGRDFIKALGVYENWTAAGGVPKDSTAVRKRIELLFAARRLLETVEACDDLLSFDYSCSLANSDGREEAGEQNGIRIRGYSCSVDTRRSGFCTLKSMEQSLSG